MNEDSFADIFAEIVGPEATPYEKGLYRLTLKMPEDFPKSPPKGYFITKIFHPNVSEKGDICVNTLKKDWDPANWSIRHILKIIHCLLINPFPESALNEEAGKIFMDNYDQYFRRAKILNDIHAIPKTLPQSKPFPRVMDEETLIGCKENQRGDEVLTKGPPGGVLSNLSSNLSNVNPMTTQAEKLLQAPLDSKKAAITNKKKWNKMI